MPERRTLPWQFLAVLLLAMVPAATALRPRLEEDTWWHLAAGEFIATRHALPDPDPFSQVGRDEGRPWVAYSWLYELALYGGYAALGLPGVLLFRDLLRLASVAAFAWFVFRRAGRPLPAIGVFALSAVTLMPLMVERPWHATIVFTVLTLDAASEVRAGRPARSFWWLPLLFALWANVHIQFVLGLCVLGIACAAGLLDRSPGRRGLIALTAACALGTLANPYHFRLYGVVWEYASQTTPLRHVQELVPPDFRHNSHWSAAALLLWAACVALRRRPVRAWDVLLLAAGAALSLRMQRDIWFGALSAAAVLVRSPEAGRTETAGVLPARWAVLAVVLAFATVRVGWALGPGAATSIAEEQARSYPVEAVRFIRDAGLPGPLYNDFNWGGFLIWNLPELPVAVDGRTNLYGEERLRRSFQTWAGVDGWDRDSELCAARLVIAPLGRPLAAKLREHPERWRVVYEDAVAAVLVAQEAGR